jgi:hypothetical protein
MHPRIDEILAQLDESRDRLREAVDSIPSGARETRPAPDRWSAAEVVEHLSMVEGRMAAGIFEKRIAQARASGVAAETDGSAVAPSFDTAGLVDRRRKVTAPAAVVPTGTLTADAAWSELERARRRLRGAILSADGLALGSVDHTHPSLGTMNLYQWALWIDGHERRHTAQVREIGEALAAQPR